MSYEKINFKNREVEKPLTFKKHVNDDGTITLEPKPGTIVEPGTPLLADHFNHMDDGIYKAHKEIDNLKLSGIERNKELVANLNSKKVSATINDSLKTNIAKVKDIKLGSGNAVASDVLQGKTFSSSQGTDLTGAMPNNGVLSKTITTQGGTKKISPGYYEGGEVKAQFNNLVPENIKSGVNIGGILGTVVQGRKNAKGIGKMNRFEVNNLPFKPSIIFATSKSVNVFGIYVNLSVLNNPAISGLINAGIFWERKEVQSYLFYMKDDGFIFSWSLTDGSADIYWYAYE